MNTSTKTRYKQVAFDLENILQSQYKPGDHLPSESKLAEKFNVNRHTIRRAIDELANLGLLLRHQGKRTQVVNNKIQYPIKSQTMFSKSLNKLGKSSVAKKISVQNLLANEEVARQLNIDIGSPIYKIKTLRFVAQQSVCVINHYLNAQLVPDMDRLYEKGSLHSFIEKQYQLTLFRKKMIVAAQAANNDLATQLQYPLGEALVVVKSVNGVDKYKENIEFSIARSRPDLIQYEMSFDEGVQ